MPLHAVNVFALRHLPALALVFVVGLLPYVVPAQDRVSDALAGGDARLQEDIALPEWFKLSFLELHDDLDDALKNGKRGLIVYFGRKDCPYCKALLEKNWGRPDIVAYTRRFFDVVAVDVKGDRLVTDMDGAVRSEREFSVLRKTQFTPTLLFYDDKGAIVFRLAGYHPPYEFRAALEYVADGHYARESFRDYLARAEPVAQLAEDALNSSPVFAGPPYALDRSRFRASRPLAVFFERVHCHACDVLHAEPLQQKAILDLLGKMEVVQLDMDADTPVVTPAGTRTTAVQWAADMELFYAPTIIFFDDGGQEIIRIDSVVKFHRLRGVLEYVLSGAWRTQPNFQLWREQRAAGK
jgi:thioredoxin-related protein